MNKYEFVPKSEYQPLRIEAEKIIRKVQRLIRGQFTFQFKLVGSGSRHLVTRIKGGNGGFDLDYNLTINNPDEDHYWKAEFARETLFKAFQEAIKGTPFNKIENSTSSITIKNVDKKNSKIVYSCDFEIMYFDDGHNYLKYARFNKNNGNYTWEPRKYSENIDYKIEIVLENYYWSAIKEEYLKLKNKNSDINKHSFQLYIEVINNLFNELEQEEDDDE